jgi:hypothetical protein
MELPLKKGPGERTAFRSGLGCDLRAGSSCAVIGIPPMAAETAILNSSVLAAIERSLSTVVHDFQEFGVILPTDDKGVRLSRLSISNCG